MFLNWTADILDTRSIVDLAMHQGHACVSVYMPTDPMGEGLGDAGRLKNLLDRAENNLSRDWMRRPEARRLLEPLRHLPLDLSFWQRRRRGLAAFVCSAQLLLFRSAVELPECVQVERRFHLLPLLALLDTSTRFWILVLGQKQVCICEADRNSIRPCHVADLPSDKEQALNLRSIGCGEMDSTWRAIAGKEQAVVPGRQSGSDRCTSDLEQLFRRVDSALHPVLRRDTAPLLLAGRDDLLVVFSRVCRYPHVAQAQLNGNVDELEFCQLHQRAWEAIEPAFLAQKASALSRYRELAPLGKATDNAWQAAEAAKEGRVQTLLIRHGCCSRSVEGNSNGSTRPAGSASRPDRAFDAIGTADARFEWDYATQWLHLEMAAVQTLRHRGALLAIPCDQMPSAEPLAAILRH